MMSIIEWVHFVVVVFISTVAVHGLYWYIKWLNMSSKPFGVDELKMINERIKAYYLVLDETNREKLKMMRNKLGLVNNNNRDSRSMYRNQLGAHWANESIFLPVSPVFIYTTAQPSTSPISPDTQYMDPTSSPSPPTQTPLMESATYIPNYYHQFQCNQHKI